MCRYYIPLTNGGSEGVVGKVVTVTTGRSSGSTYLIVGAW